MNRRCMALAAVVAVTLCTFGIGDSAAAVPAESRPGAPRGDAAALAVGSFHYVIDVAGYA